MVDYQMIYSLVLIHLFYSSKNIDIRGNAKAISLNKALVLDSSTTITEKINAIFKTSTGKMVAFGASGWIYWKKYYNLG